MHTSEKATTWIEVIGGIEAEVQQRRLSQLERKSSQKEIEELNNQINSAIQEIHVDLTFTSSDHETEEKELKKNRKRTLKS